MMGKVKVGDKVKSLVTQIDVRAGGLYEVGRIDADGGVWVIDDVGDNWYLTSEEFEILTVAAEAPEDKSAFKVGDRVQIISESLPWYRTGEIAEVIRADGGDNDCYVRCDTHRMADDCWYAKWDHLKLVSLKIEAGKYYRTRDGRKVGPVTDRGGYYCANEMHYNSDGECGLEGRHHPDQDWRDKHDLIAEWIDEPVKVSAKPTLKRGDKVKVTVDRPEYGLLEGDLGTLLEDDTDAAPFILWARTSGTWAISNDDLELVTEVEDSPNEEVTAETAIKPTLLKTNQGYGFEIARHGDYVWVDTGKKAPIVLKATDVQAAA
ncbi:hypothetical protein H9643_07975 [Ochrobactrum sp. Sa2BUA5]|nr:hypothetical protein [Ochrobactrum gallinarum]